MATKKTKTTKHFAIGDRTACGKPLVDGLELSKDKRRVTCGNCLRVIQKLAAKAKQPAKGAPKAAAPKVDKIKVESGRDFERSEIQPAFEAALKAKIAEMGLVPTGDHVRRAIRSLLRIAAQLAISNHCPAKMYKDMLKEADEKEHDGPSAPIMRAGGSLVAEYAADDYRVAKGKASNEEDDCDEEESQTA